MKYLTKVTLGCVAIASLVAVYYADNYFSEKKEAQKKLASVAISFESQDVLKLSIANKNGNISFSRESGSSPWKISSLNSAAADQVNVNNALSLLQRLSVQQELPSTEKVLAGDKQGLAQFGFDKPAHTIEIELSNKDKKKIILGSPLDLGSKEYGTLNRVSIYALNPEKKLVLVVDGNISTQLDMQGELQFRSKNIGDFKKADVISIGVKSSTEDILVVKDKVSGWKLEKPFQWSGDSNYVESFLSRYENLTAKNIYEASRAAELAKDSFDPKSPAAVVTLKNAAGNVIQTFNLNITKQNVFVSMNNGYIGQVDLNSWSDLVPKNKYFRNRQVMYSVNMNNVTAIKLTSNSFFRKKDNNWFHVTAITQQPAVSEIPNSEVSSFFSNFSLMVADEILSNPTPKDLNLYGLSNPLKTFSFVFENEKGKQIDILVGKRVPKNEKSVYLKRSDIANVYIVDAAWLSQLTQLYAVGDTMSPAAKKKVESSL